MKDICISTATQSWLLLCGATFIEVFQVHDNGNYLEIKFFQKVSPKFNSQIMYKLATLQQINLFICFHMLLYIRRMVVKSNPELSNVAIKNT